MAHKMFADFFRITRYAGGTVLSIASRFSIQPITAMFSHAKQPPKLQESVDLAIDWLIPPR